jgi:adenosylmethionine-8-amino-7-oxononanoate aminotransferase
MFAPPFIMNEKHIDEIVDKFSKSLAAVFGSESGLRKVG